MSHQYQPGDVALVKCGDGEWRKAQYRDNGAPVWAFPDGLFRRVSDSEDRPLVVLDSEDRAEVQRLAVAIWPKAMFATDALAYELQFRLRKYISPPKPPEPMKWLAVVEDQSGSLWFTHRIDAVYHEQPWYCQELDLYRDYANIDAVKVVFEGVPT